jgi:hypothetical protein
MEINTKARQKKVPKIVLRLLRRHPNSFAKVARLARVGKATVSNVAAGRRTSRRVSFAMIRVATRLAKLEGLATALEISERAGMRETQTL